jgi:hypothetical protein
LQTITENFADLPQDLIERSISQKAESTVKCVQEKKEDEVTSPIPITIVDPEIVRIASIKYFSSAIKITSFLQIKTRLNQIEFQLSKGRKDFIEKVNSIVMVN